MLMDMLTYIIGAIELGIGIYQLIRARRPKSTPAIPMKGLPEEIILARVAWQMTMLGRLNQGHGGRVDMMCEHPDWDREPFYPQSTLFP